MSPSDVISAGLCIGCGSCASRESAATMAFDPDGHLKPTGPAEWLAEGDERFAATCPFSPRAHDETRIAAALWPEASEADPWIGRWRSAWVGHAAEDLRMGGSSGGMATWIAAELLRRDMVDGVAHVVPADPSTGRLFAYTVSRQAGMLQQGAKSRYYPIDMTGILREIRAVPGRYAVIGVPCFIKAVQLARAAEPVLAQRIEFTIALVCGHMKSARMSDSFAAQMDLAPGRMATIDYRRKDPDRPANWYVARGTDHDGTTRERAWWDMAEGDWGSGFFMNSACNFCDDVVGECADVSLGDAWLEPWTSDGRGTNVVVIRSPVIEEMVARGLGEGRLTLQPVSAETVRETQAAGFRQRREGLAYRLALLPGRMKLRPKKRVAPSRDLPLRRKLIYRARMAISRWSHRMHRTAEHFDRPAIYHTWARSALAVYQALAWSRGRLGALVERMMPQGEKSRG